MVTAWLWAAALALGPGAGAAPGAVADSSGFESWRSEDALEEDGEEAAFVGANRGPFEGLDDESAAASGAPARARARGLLRFESGGGRLLRASLAARRARLDVLLAREAGESRPVDDAQASLALAPAPGLLVRGGWFEPRLGAGLVLGPRRVAPGTPAPSRAGAGGLAAPLSTLPARVAAGQRGLAVELARGALRVSGLAAWTPREARASGAALRPLLGTRHRNADEESRRGRLRERIVALAAEAAPTTGTAAWRTWAIVLHARTDPRRAPYDGSSAAAESAAAIGTGGPAAEAGAAWSARDGSATLEAALAFDAGGRRRARVLATARGAAARAALVVESEARGFVPPRALPERRPHLAATLRLEPAGRLRLALEAQAVDRGPLERPRLGCALGLAPRPGVRLVARHDGEPRATRLAVRVGGPGARLGAEARFDRAGLARRTAWVAAGTGLPGGFVVAVDARLAGGRAGVAWLDDDVSGGRLVRPGPAAARTRFELRRPGAVAPRLSWTRTTSPEGRSDELRLALHWDAGSAEPSPDDFVLPVPP